MIAVSGKIFKKSKSGRLIFIGNFDDLYAESEDPWDQSNSFATDMSNYYDESRNHLLDKLSLIKDIKSLKVAEVGCGLGYILNLISDKFDNNNLYGFDISQNAINRARQIHPRIGIFSCHNIIKSKLPISPDVVILSNLLWYILEDINDAISNAIQSISRTAPGSKYLIIHNAFFKSGEQKFGNEVISDLNDLLQHVLTSIDKLDLKGIKSIEGKIMEMPNSKYDELYMSIRFK